MAPGPVWHPPQHQGCTLGMQNVCTAGSGHSWAMCCIVQGGPPLPLPCVKSEWNRGDVFGPSTGGEWRRSDNSTDIADVNRCIKLEQTCQWSSLDV